MSARRKAEKQRARRMTMRRIRDEYLVEDSECAVSESVFVASPEQSASESDGGEVLSLTEHSLSPDLPSSSDETGSAFSDPSDVISDEDDEVFENQDDPLAERLRRVFIEKNVPRETVGAILQAINDPSLPRDPRTLLGKVRRPKRIQVEEEGTYVFLDWLSLLETFIQENDDAVVEYALQFSIDGVPIFKSTGKSCWPLQFRIVNSEILTRPSICCFFIGGKPDATKLLSEFVVEFTALQERHPRVTMHSFVADRPARSVLKAIRHHSAR